MTNQVQGISKCCAIVPCTRNWRIKKNQIKRAISNLNNPIKRIRYPTCEMLIATNDLRFGHKVGKKQLALREKHKPTTRHPTTPLSLGAKYAAAQDASY
jgi:hypothetical protein